MALHALLEELRAQRDDPLDVLERLLKPVPERESDRISCQPEALAILNPSS